MYVLAQLKYEQLKLQARMNFLYTALLINLFGLQKNVCLSKQLRNNLNKTSSRGLNESDRINKICK